MSNYKFTVCNTGHNRSIEICNSPINEHLCGVINTVIITTAGAPEKIRDMCGTFINVDGKVRPVHIR